MQRSCEHHCHAIGCEIAVRPSLLMCRAHWNMVSPDIQNAIYASFRHNQCADRKPSLDWLIAACKARLQVAQIENKKEAEKWLVRVLILLNQRKRNANRSSGDRKDEGGRMTARMKAEG